MNNVTQTKRNGREGNQFPAVDLIELRIAFLRRGETMAGWARARGCGRTTVYYAIYGKRRGKKSDAIIAALREELSRAASKEKPNDH